MRRGGGCTGLPTFPPLKRFPVFSEVDVGEMKLFYLPPFPAVFFFCSSPMWTNVLLSAYAITSCTTCEPGELENPERIWESASICPLSLGNCLSSSEEQSVCLKAPSEHDPSFTWGDSSLLCPQHHSTVLLWHRLAGALTHLSVNAFIL